MRPLFRRPRSVTATLVCLSAAYACGGGDSLESEPFPAAAGVYNVTGRFDDLPSATSYFTGTLTLTQVSRQSGDLAGSMSLVLRVEDEIINVSGAVSSATVAPDGALAFELRDGTNSWTFTGTKISGGIGSGRYTLSDETHNFSGGWEATQVATAALRAPVGTNMSVQGLAKRLPGIAQRDIRPMKRF